MTRHLPFILIGGVFVLAVASGSLLFHVKKQRMTAARIAAAEAAAKLSSAIRRGADPPHVRGPTDAPVTLEEFGDFECRPCGDLSSILDKLEEDYRGRLRFIFRQFPMRMHLHAVDAARASEAAGLQGRFWEMHDLLYRNRFLWPRAADVRTVFSDYAKSLGLDVERFANDMDGEEVRERIAADQSRGKSLGVDRTPIILIDGRQLPVSALNPQGFHAAIDQALAAQGQPMDRK